METQPRGDVMTVKMPYSGPDIGKVEITIPKSHESSMSDMDFLVDIGYTPREVVKALDIF